MKVVCILYNTTSMFYHYDFGFKVYCKHNSVLYAFLKLSFYFYLIKQSYVPYYKQWKKLTVNYNIN